MSCKNQIINIARGLLGKIAIVAGLAAVGASSGVASASIITLTGGDSGEGYSPHPTVVYAYNTGTTAETSATVQGVTFLTWKSNTASPPASPANPAGIPNTAITFTSGQAFSTTNLSMGASANDVALRTLLQYGFFAFGGTQTLTLGGLTVGQQYQVDIFVETNNDTRTENFTFTGATTPTDFFSADATHAYDVSETLAPDALGKIVVTLPVTTNPFINAFSVTLAPEPASLGFMAAGGLLLLRRRSDRRRVAA